MTLLGALALAAWLAYPKWLLARYEYALDEDGQDIARRLAQERYWIVRATRGVAMFLGYGVVWAITTLLWPLWVGPMIASRRRTAAWVAQQKQRRSAAHVARLPVAPHRIPSLLTQARHLARNRKRTGSEEHVIELFDVAIGGTPECPEIIILRWQDHMTEDEATVLVDTIAANVDRWIAPPDVTEEITN